MGSSRPPRLPPGAPLSEHYTIEGLVRYSEGRMFYLANDKRPDRPYRFCWECGSDETPRQATHCINCGIEMAHREFLISLRWDHDAHNFVDFFEQEFEHGSMIVPIDLFQERGAMCSVIDWNQEDFLLNQSSPLSTETLLDLAQRICGMLGYLHQKGISLSNIQAGNFLVRPDNNYIHFFDPDIQSIQKKPIEGEAQAQEIPFLAQLLLRYCSISETSTALMLRNAVEGAFKSPYEFGRAIEQELLNIRTEHSAGAVAAVSDVGLVRNLNEDNWGWREINDTLNIYVVADGMGGHDAGEVASHMAVNGLCDELENKLKNALKPEITLFL